MSLFILYLTSLFWSVLEIMYNSPSILFLGNQRAIIIDIAAKYFWSASRKRIPIFCFIAIMMQKLKTNISTFFALMQNNLVILHSNTLEETFLPTIREKYLLHDYEEIITIVIDSQHKLTTFLWPAAEGWIFQTRLKACYILTSEQYEDVFN